ncbi:MAG: FUSC family protein [Bacteroidetes bacterium]|nr:FUSC family protein [Bacteroidota bacterium]
MDYLKQYRSFVNSYYLSEGVRITIGVALPAIILGYFHNLSSGIMVSLGALCASLPDNAGPIHHRRNAMMVCAVVVFMVSLITGMASSSPFVLGITILIFCFVFAMIGVYGSRATSIGMAALLMMVLNLEGRHYGWELFFNSVYILCGSAWYMLLSLSIYSFRPYKLVQQALGECIQSTADYLHTRAYFYEKRNDYTKIYNQLFDNQIAVHQKQELVRELLFKSRDIVKESTTIGRALVILFLDIVDLFERIIASHQDYDLLHKIFDNKSILEKFKQVIVSMSDELDGIGIAVKSNETYPGNANLSAEINKLAAYFEEFRDKTRTAENVEAFISLRQILKNIEDMALRINTLGKYTSYDKAVIKKQRQKLDYDEFVAHQHIEPKLLLENLSVQSSVFRHSIRLCIATLAGFIVSQFFPFRHSYWILLTIIVIIKPGYSLTKKRNTERLIGTIAGALIGIAALYFIKEKAALFVLMIIFMIGAYSFMRTKYLVFVLLMTPYVLLLFRLLSPNNFQMVINDRIIDTLIGSAIAFLANIFLFPSWEHEQINDYMFKMIEANLSYFDNVAGPLLNQEKSATQYKLSRKKAFVSLANLTDAFNRMLSEPKNKQKNAQQLHQFVVSNHMLTSHIATLAYYMPGFDKNNSTYDFPAAVKAVELKLKTVLAMLAPGKKGEKTNESDWRIFNLKIDELAEKRKRELKAGIFESETKKELSNVKPVADQFNFIMGIATNLEKMEMGKN